MANSLNGLGPAFDVVRRGVADGVLPTSVLAIASQRGLIAIEAYGATSIGARYLIASITKPIFVASLLKLVERGLVLINDPVARFIPSFGEGGRARVTLWHLLTHTSGLDDGPTMARLFATPADPDALRATALNSPLLFAPGTQYAYCNASYIVMAEIIRAATGIDHDAHLEGTILRPLSMVDTTYVPPEDGRTQPVHRPDGTSDAGGSTLHGLKFPAGGLWSTAADLICFGQMLLGGGEREGVRILSRAAHRVMTQLHTEGIPTNNADGTFASGYGLGLAKAVAHRWQAPSAELTSADGYGHGGATGTVLWVEPEADLVFVFLTNRLGLDSPQARLALNAAIAAMTA